jgi:type VI secretion system protein ImpA
MDAPLLDFAELLAPIPGDDPAGSAVDFMVGEQLREARKEDLEASPVRKPDWLRIIRLAQQTLTGSSKNLDVAARLTEALVRQHGFAGLRDGLRLMREIVEGCWDRIYPGVEDGDIEPRAAPFYWLDDPVKGACFPSTIRAVPVVSGEAGGYGWLEWRESQSGKGPVSREDFEKALLATPPETCSATVDHIKQSREELGHLVSALNAKMGAEAPALTAVAQALEECSGLAEEILRRKRPDSGAETHPPSDGEAAAAPGQARAPSSRAEAYRQLAQAAAILKEIEPHSPIPYLIQRAVELGGLPFPQLIKALIRDPVVLTELSREFGIQEPPPKE